MEFLQSFHRCHFAGKPVAASQDVSCFLRLAVLWSVVLHTTYLCVIIVKFKTNLWT